MPPPRLSPLAYTFTIDATVALIRVATRIVSDANMPDAHPARMRVKDVIERTDVLTRLQLVHAYLIEVSANRWIKERPSVKLATDSVRTAVDNLRAHADAIETELDEHANRYLQGWRSPSVDNGIEGITLWSIRLEERLQALREVVKLAALQYPDKEA